MAWETQGPIVDRSTELLGASDKGILMFRKLLREQIERVQDGGEPAGVIRDGALNRIIELSVSRGLSNMTQELEPDDGVTAGMRSVFASANGD
jgi:hypothetical protein